MHRMCTPRERESKTKEKKKASSHTNKRYRETDREKYNEHKVLFA